MRQGKVRRRGPSRNSPLLRRARSQRAGARLCLFSRMSRPAISSQAPAPRHRGPCVRPCHAEPGVEVWLDRASNQLPAQPESRPNARRRERWTSLRPWPQAPGRQRRFRARMAVRCDRWECINCAASTRRTNCSCRRRRTILNAARDHTRWLAIMWWSMVPW